METAKRGLINPHFGSLTVLVLSLGFSVLQGNIAEGGPPLGWNQQNIGPLGHYNGTADADAAGVFSITSSGQDIWGPVDSFQFVYQSLNGDGQIIAHFLGMDSTNGWAKAGLMIRETLGARSINAVVAGTPANGAVFQWRKASGEESYRVVSARPIVPDWMKLVRRGNWLGAYMSEDGVTWTLLDWQTLTLSPQAYIGLAVSSHDPSSTCTAWFDQIEITTATPTDPLPVVGAGNGLAGAYFANPALEGTPSLGRVDNSVDFDWGWGAPPDLTVSNLFSVRWMGQIQAQFTERYTFFLESDDGVTMWLNDQQLINDWIDRDGGESIFSADLVAGEKYPIRIEYYDNQNVAKVRLKWSSPSTPKRTVPQSQLFAPDTDGDGIPDAWELANGLDPADPDDATAVSQEGLTWLAKYQATLTSVTSWGVPAPWLHTDVGLNAGSDAGCSNGVFTVVGYGADIWGTNDAFHFVYQPVTGNVQIVARFLGAHAKHEWAKSGLMIRENLAADSQHAMLVEPTGYGLSFQWRSGKAEETFHSADDWGLPPYWMKLVRWENWIGGFRSKDGTTWTLTDWEPVHLGQEVNVGLVSCSHDDQSLCAARFDQVRISPAAQPDHLPVLGTGDGLRGDYFDNSGLIGSPVLTRVDSTVNFGWHFGSPFNVLYGDNFSVRWTGEIQPRHSEPYTFFLETDDGVRMWLNEQLLINEWNDRNQGESSATINLVGGQKYLIRIEYYEHLGAAEAHLKWSSPSTSKRNIPPSQLYSQPTDSDGNGIADAWELHYFGQLGVEPNSDPDGDGLSNLQEYNNFTDPHSADSDGDGMSDQWELSHGLSPNENGEPGNDSDFDGLSDLEEFQRGTDPQNPDTDGDGVPDGLEVKYLGTDPKVSNPGLLTEEASAKGAQAIPLLGRWQVDGDDVYGQDRRGQVAFNLQVTHPDKFLLKLEGTQNQPGSPQTRFNLLYSVDGESLGHRTLVAGYGTNGTVQLVTPFLSTGQHDIRIYWDEAASFSFLRIKTVKLLAVNGPDTNGEGMKDWVKKMVNDESGLDNVSSLDSLTSPVCLEGRDPYGSMMTAGFGPAASSLAVVRSSAGRWFANLPLSAEGNADVTLSYQNRAKVQTASIHWSPLDVLQATNLSIRVGDSLLLTAQASRQASVELSVVSEGHVVAHYLTDPGHPVPHSFSSAGDFTVTATVTSAHGSPKTGSIALKVVGHNFPPDPICLMSSSRDWDIPRLPQGVTITTDPRLKLTKTADLGDGARFSLVTDRNEPRTIISRVGPIGPILDSAQAEGIRFFPTPDTYNAVLKTYPDGSRLVETMQVVSPVPTNITVQVKIIVGGVTFDDGTVYREISAPDFDSLGQYKLRFVLPMGTQTANCHRITIMQGPARVGTY